MMHTSATLGRCSSEESPHSPATRGREPNTDASVDLLVNAGWISSIWSWMKAHMRVLNVRHSSLLHV